MKRSCTNLCACVVMPPQRPNLVLTADVPDIKLDVFVRYSLDVEPYGRDGRNRLVEFEFVKDGWSSR